MRHSHRIAALALPLALLLAPGARAVAVDVRYEITMQLSVPALGPTAIFSGPGSLELRFANGTSGSHVSPGPFTVRSGTADLDGSFSALANFFHGSQFLSNLGIGAGSIGTAGILTASTAAHFVSGFIHCTGFNCTTFGFPASSNYPLTSATRMLTLYGPVLGFPSVGPQSINLVGSAGTIMGLQVYVQVQGQEVSRMPEPDRAALLGAGLLGLAVLGFAVHRRSR